ncbi:MAG: diphthine synthase [Nanoarchaeota archaeon]
MLYLIGLGLNSKGYSKEAYETVEKADKLYLESYTVEFHYSKEEIEKEFGKKIEDADREKVENLSLIDEAKKQDVALLIYGTPLTATTHITLIQEAKKKKVKIKVIHSASVLDAIAETGLQIYKFGKITSIPNFEADSFIKIVKENLSINAHSLILVDIGMNFSEALDKIANACAKHKVKLEKVIACSRLGNSDSKIYYDGTNNLKSKKVKAPFCIIIPGKLHFVEKEFLEGFS